MGEKDKPKGRMGSVRENGINVVEITTKGRNDAAMKTIIAINKASGTHSAH